MTTFRSTHSPLVQVLHRLLHAIFDVVKPRHGAAHIAAAVAASGQPSGA